jgi:CheY-like chemotaxis protein
VQAQPPDVIVLDGAVLEDDSPHYRKELSDRLTTVDVPIVLLIHHALWLTSEYPLKSQVVGAISKPFNPLTLPIDIAHLLGWRLACDLN